MIDTSDAGLFYALLRFEEAGLALRTALQLRIVDQIGSEVLPIDELGQRFGFTNQASRTYFTLLIAMRLLERHDDGYAVSADAQAALGHDASTSRSRYLSMGTGDDVDQLVAQLRGERGDTPPLYGEEDGAETLMDIDEIGRAIAYGLSSRARNFAGPLAKAIAVHADRAQVLADIGAGSPYVADACLKNMLALQKGILVDRPNGMRFARQIAADRSIDTSKIEFCERDFFQSVPPADIYCVSNTAHDWLREDYLRLMSNLRSSINVDGVVCIHEPLLLTDWSTDQQWFKALWMACYALTLFKLTAGQGSCYTIGEHDEILSVAGFQRIAEPVDTSDGCTAVFYRV